MIEARYQKNIGLIGEEGQKKLCRSKVAIIGAGGLGGTVFEILLRAGVGHITIIDFDSFEESNLNRQLLSSTTAIGTNKAKAALTRAREINPNVRVKAICERLTEDNADGLIEGSNLVCDCLGNIADRFILERATKRMGIPMVHAAVAGTKGQILSVFPDDSGLAAIYGDAGQGLSAGEESELGTPTPTVLAVASLQAHEAIAILTGIQKPLRQTLLRIDLADWRLMRIDLKGST